MSAPVTPGVAQSVLLAASLSEVLSRAGWNPVLFVWAWLQGEAAVIVGGAMAAQGYWPWWAIWLVGAVPATVGHQLYYLLGRWFGPRLLARFPERSQPAIERARTRVLEHSTQIMVMMRFAYGIRVPLPIICGVVKVPWRKYVLYNFATALVWSLVFTMLGFIFGVVAQSVLRRVSGYAAAVTIAAIALGIGIHLLTHWWGQRSLSKQ